MRQKSSSLLISLICLVLLSGLASAQRSPLAVKLESYLVTFLTLPDGSVQERFGDAEKAQPGQVLEYRLSVVNESAEALSAGTVAVTGPIPATTAYLADSATPASKLALREFSADGGASYAEVPMVKVTNEAGEEEEVAAPPEQYTVARWTLVEALMPGQTLSFSYRVAVK